MLVKSLSRLPRSFSVSLFSLGLAFMSLPAHATEQFALYTGTGNNDIDNAAYGTFLETYVTLSADGITRVDYGAVTDEDEAALATYIEALEAVDPTELSSEAGFAYWVNLYNAVTVRTILDNYPVSSIRDIKTGFRAGPWRQKQIVVNGEDLSLDDVEHKILRKYWNEPRVHYAVNCASIGCPNLSPTPFTAEKLEEQLTAAATAYVNHPRGVTVLDNGSLQVSSIYKWFRKDFGRTDQEVITHLMRYASDELRKSLTQTDRISRDQYDWSLNDTATYSVEK